MTKVYEQIFSSYVIKPNGSAPFHKVADPPSIDQSPLAFYCKLTISYHKLVHLLGRKLLTLTSFDEYKLVQVGHELVHGFIGFAVGAGVVGPGAVVVCPLTVVWPAMVVCGFTIGSKL
jgi:hypothetical protein